MKQLIAALAAAQKDVLPMKKDGYNDFDKFHYVTAESIVSYAKEVMAPHGLFVVRGTVKWDGGDAPKVKVWFTLVHSSGEMMPDACFELPAQPRKGWPADKAALASITSATAGYLVGLLQIPRGGEVSDADDSNYDPAEESLSRIVEKAMASGSADEVRALYKEARETIAHKANKTRRDQQTLVSLVNRGKALKEAGKPGLDIQKEELQTPKYTPPQNIVLTPKEKLKPERKDALPDHVIARGAYAEEGQEPQEETATEVIITNCRIAEEGQREEPKKPKQKVQKAILDYVPEQMMCVETGEIVDLDPRKVIWDAELHSGSKSLTLEGGWRGKRGVKDYKQRELRVDEDGAAVFALSWEEVPGKTYAPISVKSEAPKAPEATQEQEPEEQPISPERVPGNDDLDEEAFDWGGE